MLTERAQSIKSTLIGHVKHRLENALNKIGDKNDAISRKAREKAHDEYDLTYILKEGSKYSNQVQIATHLAKGVHPDLKVKHTSNINVSPLSLNDCGLIGHHSLSGKNWSADASGNGAVNKKGYELHLLLQTEFQGTSYFDLLVKGDLDAVSIIRDTLGESESDESVITRLYDDKAEKLGSHSLAKQLFWLISDNPLDDDNFHLIAPLYPSSLVHFVHKSISEARYGKTNSEARKSKKDGVPSELTFIDYRGVAFLKLGGTKPQNISQLNSERGGVNYLLSSSPPIWKNRRKKSYLSVDNALTRFRAFEDVNLLVRKLVALLKSNPDPTMETRKRREQLDYKLGQALADFGCVIRNENEPGWTRSAECTLSLHQKVWLDPDRAELPLRQDYEADDSEFQKALEWKDWPDKVAKDFALWLNATLRKEEVPVGDTELKHWVRQALVEASHD